VVDPVTDPDDDLDNDDDGVNILNPVPGGIQSLVLSMRPGTEPTTDDGEDGLIADNNSNLSVDFGFFEQLTLGNRVWFDADNDGSIGILESGVGPGLVMELLDQNGAPVLDPVSSLPITGTTDANGFYQFSYLFPGDYRVRIAAVNFQASGLLSGFLSSTGVVDPDNDADSDDNGNDTTDPTLTGIFSEAVTLAYDAETLSDQDGDGNDNTNLTIDFGVLLDPTAVTLIQFTATSLGGRDVRVVWETAVEQDNFAFNLMRSQINDISTADWVYTDYATHPNGAVYSYEDTVPNSGTWYYWLIDVDTKGKTTAHGPVAVTASGQYSLFLPMVVSP